MKSVGDRLRHAMSVRGINQPTLAERCRGKVSQQTISRLLTEPNARTTKLPELAGALNIDLDWLATGHGHRPEDGLAILGANDVLEVGALFSAVNPRIQAALLTVMRRLADGDPDAVLEWTLRAAMGAKDDEAESRPPLAQTLRDLADLVERVPARTRQTG
jgi:transcriptional regulator with XRE-family HTH domain